MSIGVLRLLVLAVLVASSCGEAAPEQDTADEIAAGGAVVSRVIDGDSLELDLEGTTVEARLVGVNAPELADCQGPAARDALASVVEPQPVRVVEFGTDRFDRLLVELIVGDESVNQALVRAGWALGLHGDERDWTEAMVSAAEGGLGMWDLPEACEPSEEQLRLGDTNVDPAGPDDEVLEDEWVELVNDGPTTISLSGWTLRDESTSNRFTFSSGSVEPGARVRLRTGCGEDTPTDIYWCSPNGVWSNRGETVLLLAPSGAIHDQLFL